MDEWADAVHQNGPRLRTERQRQGGRGSAAQGFGPDSRLGQSGEIQVTSLRNKKTRSRPPVARNQCPKVDVGRV